MKRGTRSVQGLEVVRQGRRRPAESELQPADLPNPPLDLSRQTYLSVEEVVAYGRFESTGAFHKWASRKRPPVPKCAGRRSLYLRRDIDEALQSENRPVPAAVHKARS